MIHRGAKLLTKQDVHGKLGVSLRTLDRMIAKGSIPFVRVRSFTGGKQRVRFNSDELDTWLERRVNNFNNN